jgi:hypothetical protein
VEMVSQGKKEIAHVLLLLFVLALASQFEVCIPLLLTKVPFYLMMIQKHISGHLALICFFNILYFQGSRF